MTDAEAQTILDTRSLDPIGNNRARDLHRELAKFGITSGTHYAFASEILERPIQSLASLTEPDALRIWTTARDNAIDDASLPS